MIDERIFKNEERAVYTLRSLYSRFGYRPYKMSKFEEYDLYVKNKDFLISDGIITFTSHSGRLMALKPDVTLSIVKNFKGEGGVEKYYYNENVYRTAKSSREFKEIMQTGLECIGDIGIYEMTEVLSLAVRSLVAMSESSVLDLTHVGLVSALLNAMDVSEKTREALLAALERKSRDTLSSLVATGEIKEEGQALLLSLMDEYASIEDAVRALTPYVKDETTSAALSEFVEVVNALAALGLAKYLNISFSLLANASYYSGIVFQGYIKGLPDRVLSGGRYDGLMRRMGKNAGAIGFAVYLDALERMNDVEKKYDVDVLLLKSSDTPSEAIVRAVEALSRDGSSVLVQAFVPSGLRYRRLVNISEMVN